MSIRYWLHTCMGEMALDIHTYADIGSLPRPGWIEAQDLECAAQDPRPTGDQKKKYWTSW